MPPSVQLTETVTLPEPLSGTKSLCTMSVPLLSVFVIVQLPVVVTRLNATAAQPVSFAV